MEFDDISQIPNHVQKKPEIELASYNSTEGQQQRNLLVTPVHNQSDPGSPSQALATERQLLNAKPNVGSKVVSKNQLQQVNQEFGDSLGDTDFDRLETIQNQAPVVTQEDEFPDKGLSHLKKVEYLDLLQSTVTPFDFYSPVQVIKNPEKNDEFITVQLVQQSIKPFSSYYEQKTMPLKLTCDCLGKEYRSRTALEYMSKLNIEGMEPCEEPCKVCTNVAANGNWICMKCEGKYCPDCYTQYYVRRKLEQKTQKHHFYSDYQLADQNKSINGNFGLPHQLSKAYPKSTQNEETAQPLVTEFAVIGFWKSQQICYAQYRVDNPVLYNRQNEKIFLHLGENRQLYLLSRKSPILVQYDNCPKVVELELCQVDLNKIPREQEVHQFEMESLPIQGDRHSIKNDSEWGSKIFTQFFVDSKLGSLLPNTLNTVQQQTALKIVNQTLILQAHSKKKEGSDVHSDGSLVFYKFSSQTGFEIKDGVLFVQSFDSDKKILFIDNQGVFKSRDWDTPISQDEPQIASRIDGSDLKVLVSPTLTVFLHKENKRCTIVSNKKTLTYELSHEPNKPIQAQLKIAENWHEACVGLIQSENISNKRQFYLVVGLVISLEEITTNLVPFDLKMYSFEDDEMLRVDTVTVRVPNDVLASYDSTELPHTVCPLYYHHSKKKQFTGVIFLQDPKTKVPTMVYTQSKAKDNIMTTLLKSNELTRKYDLSKSSVSEEPWSLQQSPNLAMSYVMLRQEHHTEYPIQISSTYHPRRNKIIIANLSLNNYRVMLDLGEYRLAKFISCPVHNTLSLDEDNQGVIRMYFLVSATGDNVRGLTLLRYDVPTIPRAPKNSKFSDLLEIGVGEICFNTNEVPFVEKFPHMFGIQNAYVWRPQKSEQTDVYLVVQNIETVMLFSLDRDQEDATKVHNMSEDDVIAPIPITFFHKYFYFVHKESNTNSSVVAVEIEPKGKPVRQMIHHQNSQIIAMRIDSRNYETYDHWLNFLDSDKLLHKIAVFIEPNGGLCVNMKLTSSQEIGQNLINLKKDVNWNKMFIADRSFQYLNNHKLSMKIYDAQQKLQYISLGYFRDHFHQQTSSFCLSIERCNYVHREQVVMQEGDYFRYIHTKNDFDSKFIDPFSQKVKNTVNQIYLWGSNIVVQFKNDVLVYYDDRQMMINRVQRFRLSQVIGEGPNPQKQNKNLRALMRDQYVAQELYGCTKICKLDRSYEWSTLIHDLQSLMRTISSKETKAKYPNMQCFTRYPSIDQQGRLVLVWLYSKESADSSRIKGKTPMLGHRIRLDTDEPDEIRIDTEVFGKTEHNVEVVNYFIREEHDILQSFNVKEKETKKALKQKNKFEMQVIFSSNFLVWTTPKRVNFAQLSDIKEAEQFRANPRSAHRNKNKCALGCKRAHDKCSGFFKAKFENLKSKLTTCPCSKGNKKGDNEEEGDSDGELQALDLFDEEAPERTDDKVVVNRVELEDLFASEILRSQIKIFQIYTENRTFVIRDRKARLDSIQIRIGQHVSLIWDMKENEEVTNIIGWSHMSEPANLVRCGHHLTASDESEIIQSRDCGLFVNKSWCARLYSECDLKQMLDIEENNKMGKQIKVIDEEMLIANVRGQTFFTSPICSYDQLQVVVNQLRTKEYQQVYEPQNLMAQQQDHPFLRQLYQILLLPTKIVENTLNGSKRKEDASSCKPESILKYGLHHNRLLFKQVLQLLLMSSEIRLSNLVNEFVDMDQLLEGFNEYVNRFLERSMIQTKQTKAIASLHSLEKHESLIFGGSSPLIIEGKMRDKFAKEIKKSPDTEVLPYTVTVLEVEWLSGKIPLILQRIMKSDELVFDNLLIKILMAQLDFTTHIAISMLLPFCCYMFLVCYYYCFYMIVVTEDEYGFFQGPVQGVTLRCLILICTIYLGTIELIQFFAVKLNVYLRSTQNINNVIMLVLNLFIVCMHANQGLSIFVLAVIASFACMHLWFNMFLWLRIAHSTAIYVMLISQTIKDLGWFMVTFIMCICSFANAVSVINGSLYQGGDEDFFADAFEVSVLDSFVNQYLLSLGEFSYLWSDTAAGKIMWCYFLLGTFMSQIVFFNMLIAIMATTYGNVMEHEDRNVLKMKTHLFTDYIRWLNLIGKKQKKLFAMRYIYSASLQSEEMNANTMEDTIRNINDRLDEGFRKLHVEVSNVIDQIKVQKDDQIKFVKLMKDEQDKEKDAEERQKTETVSLIHDFQAKQNQENAHLNQKLDKLTQLIEHMQESKQ